MEGWPCLCSAPGVEGWVVMGGGPYHCKESGERSCGKESGVAGWLLHRDVSGVAGCLFQRVVSGVCGWLFQRKESEVGGWLSLCQESSSGVLAEPQPSSSLRAIATCSVTVSRLLMTFLAMPLQLHLQICN